MLRAAAVLLCVLLPLCAPAQSPQLPSEVAAARYVMVTSEGGEDLFREDPQDRRVRFAVEDYLKKWRRFVVVYEPANADLILAVRRGRLGSVRVGGRVGGGSTGRMPGGTSVGTEAGVPWDSLTVYRGGRGVRLETATPLWWDRADDALDLPDLPAMQRFRQAVEERERQTRSDDAWKKAARAIAEKVQALGKAERLSKAEVERLTRAISDRIRGDAELTARVAEGDHSGVEKLYRELRAGQ